MQAEYATAIQVPQHFAKLMSEISHKTPHQESIVCNSHRPLEDMLQRYLMDRLERELAEIHNCVTKVMNNVSSI
jgi:hypothetical protein